VAFTFIFYCILLISITKIIIIVINNKTNFKWKLKIMILRINLCFYWFKHFLEAE